MRLQISATSPEHPADLLDLPWQIPLEQWPEESLVALPRGISRHVVRFARAGHEVVAIKEVPRVGGGARVRAAARPRPAGDARGGPDRGGDRRRVGADGEPLEPALITRHLAGSLPYRSMFETTMRPGTVNRLLDALAVLLVRLHLVGLRVGRLLAVQHPLPPGRRRLRRVPGGRRDRPAPAPAEPGAAGVRHRAGPGEHRRRADGPGGRRLAAPLGRPGPVRRGDRAALRRPVARADPRVGVPGGQAALHRPPDPPAQRPRLRRGRDADPALARRATRSPSCRRWWTPATTSANCSG